jgi:hypothetical protein
MPQIDQNKVEQLFDMMPFNDIEQNVMQQLPPFIPDPLIIDAEIVQEILYSYGK